MKIVVLLFALTLGACGAPTPSTPTTAAVTTGIEIRNPWAAPTPGGVHVSAGYLTIVNHETTGDTLIGATSVRANSVDVHSMSMDNGVMQMRPAGEISIPPGGTLTLAPGGLHLMFNDVSTPFAEGENIPLTLHFERGGDIDTTLNVRRTPPASP